ncbi:hypothetical protein BH09PAT4_BH09PAT4_05900 [soil metagenome]
MAFKQFEVEDIGTVTVYKRRGAKNIRLTVDHLGKVKVSMPTWTPYTAGISFVQTKSAWLKTQLAKSQQHELEPGGIIGKQHRLFFVSQAGSKVRSRVDSAGNITIYHPPELSWASTQVQTVAQRASIRALRAEAEDILPSRLKNLSLQYGFSFSSVTVRHLKSRWGSCDQNTHITLNLYLMQLPWHLIDYVLLHELTHTQVMQHGPKFWTAMTELLPDVQQLRKEIRNHRAILLH